MDNPETGICNPRPRFDQGEMMWVYLEGGPYDGQVWDTSALLGRVNPTPGIEYYDWTPGTKESTKTGRVAAVWRYNETRAQGRTE